MNEIRFSQELTSCFRSLIEGIDSQLQVMGGEVEGVIGLDEWVIFRKNLKLNVAKTVYYGIDYVLPVEPLAHPVEVVNMKYININKGLVVESGGLCYKSSWSYPTHATVNAQLCINPSSGVIRYMLTTSAKKTVCEPRDVGVEKNDGFFKIISSTTYPIQYDRQLLLYSAFTRLMENPPNGDDLTI